VKTNHLFRRIDMLKLTVEQMEKANGGNYDGCDLLGGGLIAMGLIGGVLLAGAVTGGAAWVVAGMYAVPKIAAGIIVAEQC
jgi:hypothetical protein